MDPEFPKMERESFRELLEGLTLLKRLPTLAEVADTAAFLASDRAGAITGTVAISPVVQASIDRGVRQHESTIWRNSTMRVCHRNVKFDPSKALTTRRALLLAFPVLYTSGLLP
jgi:hypothetical protein